MKCLTYACVLLVFLRILSNETLSQTVPPPEASGLPPVDDPAVAAIVGANPTDPSDLLRAVDLLARLDRADLANGLLQKLIELKLSDPQFVQLHDEFGTGVLLRLSLNKDLAPQAREFVNQVFQATNEQNRDVKRVSDRIEHLLAEDDRSARLRIAAQLIDAGPYAVSPILQAISKSSDHQIVPELRSILTRIGDVAVDPLIAACQSTSEAIRAESIAALGRIKDRRALPHFARPMYGTNSASLERQAALVAYQHGMGRIPSRDDAIKLLKQAADRHFLGDITRDLDLAGDADVWIWDAPNGRSVPVKLAGVDAAALLAARLYGDLTEIEPEVSEHRIRFLVAKLESDKAIGGLDRPLRPGTGSALELAIATEPTTIEQVLELAIATDHIAAAIAACEVLAESGSINLVASAGEQPRVLARALGHPDPRLRFAAATTIARVVGAKAFTGQGLLIEQLCHFAGSTGHRRVLVGHPRADIAERIAGMLRDANFTCDTATSSGDFLKSSITSPDYEFFLISDAMNDLPAREVIQWLRRDPRTAQVPVAMLVRQFSEDQLPANDPEPLATSFVEPPDRETVSQITARLVSLAGRDTIPAECRLEQASIAYDLLLGLSEDTNFQERFNLTKHFRLIERGMLTPPLSVKAIQLMSRLGSRQAQTALTVVANAPAVPNELRRQSAGAFANSVDRFGVLLTRSQVQGQLNLLPQNQESGDDELQSTIVDAIRRRYSR